MAFDSALKRAVSALLCRVAASRAVRRLLVVLGLMAAGWLLGGAAQAHADGPVPADASRVVTDAPVLGDAVRVARAAADREAQVPVPRPALPVRTIVGEAVKERRPVEAAVPPAAVPDARPVERNVPQTVRPRAEAVEAPADRNTAAASLTPRRPVAKKAEDAERALVRKAHLKRHTAPEASDQAGDARPLAPLPAPAEAGSALPTSGLILIGGIGAPPARRAWALNRPRGVLLRAPGAVPPAVRTAADEPSFAPD
ncbi:hypothetical protein ACFVH6_11305 [Spirillospora sp. NPDC127200]